MEQPFENGPDAVLEITLSKMKIGCDNGTMATTVTIAVQRRIHDRMRTERQLAATGVR